MTTKIIGEEVFIFQKMVDGDENAFKYFFDTYYDDLCNFVNSYLRSETLSEDVVQDIFIYLWENKSTLKLKKSVKSYLYTASKNKTLNYLRDQNNKYRIAKKNIPQQELITPGADQYLEFDELKHIIGLSIESLPIKCRKIYQLSRDCKMTNSKIAA